MRLRLEAHENGKKSAMNALCSDLFRIFSRIDGLSESSIKRMLEPLELSSAEYDFVLAVAQEEQLYDSRTFPIATIKQELEILRWRLQEETKSDDESGVTPHYKIVRRAAIELWKNRCALCYRDDCRLEAHHRTYEREGKEWLTDLIPLCPECHRLADQQRKITRTMNADPIYGQSKLFALKS